MKREMLRYQKKKRVSHRCKYLNVLNDICSTKRGGLYFFQF